MSFFKRICFALIIAFYKGKFLGSAQFKHTQGASYLGYDEADLNNKVIGILLGYCIELDKIFNRKLLFIFLF